MKLWGGPPGPRSAPGRPPERVQGDPRGTMRFQPPQPQSNFHNGDGADRAGPRFLVLTLTETGSGTLIDCHEFNRFYELIPMSVRDETNAGEKIAP